MEATLTAHQARIAAVWDEHRPAMVARLELLERAQIDPTLREQAREAAHQLAGTAGTFGFPQASELARRCELLLAAGDASGHEMAPWVAGIRSEIGAAPFTATTKPPAPEPRPLPLLLVVTDDPGTGERMRAEASRRGLRVMTARIDDAQAKLDRDAPAAVLLDLSAPGADALLEAHPTVLTLNGTDRGEVARRGAAAFLDEGTTAADAVDQVTLELGRRPPAVDRVLVAGTDAAPLIAAGFEVVDTEPDAIVLGPNELERCRILRNDPRWALVPVVVVGKVNAAEAFAAGADDVTPATQLDVRLRHHLARARVHASLAARDPRTGLRSRRTGASALSHLLRLAERLAKPVCLAVVDGDDAALGERLRSSFRGEDVVARWDDGRLVVGLFGLDRQSAMDRLSALIDVGAGVAQFPVDGADLESLYTAADDALCDHPGEVAGAGRGPHGTQQVDVAIIEDEDATSELIARTLTDRGLRCFRFSNGAGVVQMLLGEQPRVRARVILLDLNLPAVDGMELLTLFAREGILRSARTLVVSADDDPATIERARSLGAETYVIKPIDLDALCVQVDDALGRR